MLTLCNINALRASKILNIYLKEANSSEKHEEFDENVFKNKKYKVSVKYGAKIILFPNLTFKHFTQNI